MRYDLNLLKAFDNLFRERSVSRAADALGLSQPAMSSHLARLRELFQDPLFLRERYGITPTEKALRLHPAVASALADLDRLVLQEQVFNPASAARTFQIAANDYFEALLLPTLVQRLSDLAPGIHLEVTSLNQQVSETGVMSGQTQLAFGRISDPPDNLIMRQALTDDLACLLSQDSLTANRAWGIDEYQRREHVVVKPTAKLSTGVFQQVAQQGIERKIKHQVTHFHYVPALIKGTEWVATLPRGICREFAKLDGLCLQEVPFPQEPFPFQLAWHRRYQQDPAHQWLRQQVFELCEQK